MTNFTFNIPDDLKRKMDLHPEFNWSEVARQAFKQKIEDFEFLEKVSAKSDLTEEDAVELGRKVRKGVTLRMKALQNKL